jgi:hypothetical protein
MSSDRKGANKFGHEFTRMNANPMNPRPSAQSAVKSFWFSQKLVASS